jgi:hypothetical protein
MKILVCPLNWGLGHATRCVPIVDQLLNDGHRVVIAADGYPLTLLKSRFSQLRYINLPSYSISYSSSNTQIWAMLRSIPQIISGIIFEHRWLKQLLKSEKFSMVISDNRFGMWHRDVKSVYITHQLMIKLPSSLKILEPLVWMIHRSIIKKYHECWIPDDVILRLSGDLSHSYQLPANAKFIGTLSRFSLLKRIPSIPKYQTVVLVSGPEPHRSILEREMILEYKNRTHSTLILQGKPSAKNVKITLGSVTLFSHLDDENLASYLVGCKEIVARSGYSTIMDLHVLGCLHKARLIPTPGQTEQEYLATITNQHISIEQTPSIK